MSINIKKTVLFLITLVSLVPNLGITFTTFGFTWTGYRLVVPICFLISVFLERERKSIITSKRENRKYVLLISVWLSYGFILMVLSPYRDLHKGLVELLSLFNGLLCIFLLGRWTDNINDFDWIIRIIYVICFYLIGLGIFEIITGYHLYMSEFNDKAVSSRIQYMKGATGIFYGVNDFSAFLSSFLPVFLYKNRKKIFNIMAIVGILFINYMNDANICTIALFTGLLFYIVFFRKIGVKEKKLLKLIVFFLLFFVLVFLVLYMNQLSNHVSFFYTLKTQVENISKSQGSLWTRLTIYKDSLKAAYDTYFLGIGPFSFTNYFMKYPSMSRLVNPHNMYLEILVEYGIFIAVGVVYLLIRLVVLFVKKIKQCGNKNERRKLICICEMLIIYSIVCISSSSFIGYAWQWIIVALGSLMIDIISKKTINKNNYYIIENDKVVL